MQSDDLEKEVRSFLTRHIQTYEQLEILLVLQRRRNDPFTLASLSAEAGVIADTVETALAGLSRAQLVEQDEDGKFFRYAPRTRDLDEEVEKLALLYSQDRLKVVQLMTEGAIERVRSKVASELLGDLRGRNKKDS